MMFDTVGVIREKCWQYKAIGRPCRPDIAIAPNGVLKSEEIFLKSLENNLQWQVLELKYMYIK